ncbi:MAG: TlpA disulfide reductase family protein [Bacteroidota bacterium]
MKSFKCFISLLCFLPFALVQAQTVDEVVRQYQTALVDLETLHCQVAQLDTFVGGTVWQHAGELTMMRNTADSLFGFRFKASKDVGDEALYDGLSEFQINHVKQTYELNANPQYYITGSPGGQLVVPELMNYQDPEVSPELIVEETVYVLLYTYPDIEEYDVRKREKKLYLDKSSFLPVKVIRRQESLGKKQVLTRTITALQINREEDQGAFQKDFLSSYKMVTEDLEEDIHLDLLNTQVEDFRLTAFTGGELSTRPTGTKLLLLDFWEVWCGPCVQSLPKVQALADKYGKEGLAVIGVLMDPKSQDSAERLLDLKGISFPQALGDKKLREYFRIFAIPQYVLIDQDGLIQQVFQGYDKEMEKVIGKLLAMEK